MPTGCLNDRQQIWLQGSISELLGYTYRDMPGAFGPAYGVSPPSIRFHVTQQLPTGPHPMTTDALVTSNNAISFSHAVENTEREDKERIEDVSITHPVRTVNQIIGKKLYALLQQVPLAS